MAITCKSSGIFEENTRESLKIMLELIETCDTNKSLISVECQSINAVFSRVGASDRCAIGSVCNRVGAQSDQWAIGSVS